MKLFEIKSVPVNAFEHKFEERCVQTSSSLASLKRIGRYLANDVNPKNVHNIQNEHIWYSDVVMGNELMTSAKSFYLYADDTTTFRIDA